MELSNETPDWLKKVKKEFPNAWQDFRVFLSKKWPFWKDKVACGPDTIWFCVCPIEMQTSYFLKYFFRVPGVDRRHLHSLSLDIIRDDTVVQTLITDCFRQREMELKV